MTELVPAAPQGAHRFFGGRLALAESFAAELADTGVSHGLIGPREVPRLWERHVLNCAVVSELLPEAARVIDVGSGAGLPGIALAIARPDIEVTLVEPMVRRTTWLEATISNLGLENARVLRGRAPEVASAVTAPIVTARAVARLDKLATWCVPLMGSGGGSLLAMKGESVDEELAEASEELERLGLVHAHRHSCGETVLETPTLVAELQFKPSTRSAKKSGRRPQGRRHK